MATISVAGQQPVKGKKLTILTNVGKIGVGSALVIMYVGTVFAYKLKTGFETTCFKPKRPRLQPTKQKQIKPLKGQHFHGLGSKKC